MGKIAALLGVILVVCLVACGGESETVDETSPAEIAEIEEPVTSTPLPPTFTVGPPTDTPVPPTPNALQVAMTQSASTREIATPIPTLSIAEVQFEVSWDGAECVIFGPEEVPVGIYQFVFRDPFKDLPEQRQELYVSNLTYGHTFQDALSKQSEPGEYFGKPSWFVHALGMRDWDDDKDVEIVAFDLSLEGEYVIYLGNNTSIWLCAPLMVVDESSSKPILPTPNPMQAAMTEQAQGIVTPKPTGTAAPMSCVDVEGVCLFVAFDGKDCLYEGSSDLTSGQVTLLFVNNSLSEASANIWKHNEGRTFQEMVEYIEQDPPPEAHPPWSNSVPGVHGYIGAGRSRAWEGLLTPGMYTVLCGAPHQPNIAAGITVND